MVKENGIKLIEWEYNAETDLGTIKFEIDTRKWTMDEVEKTVRQKLKEVFETGAREMERQMLEGWEK